MFGYRRAQVDEAITARDNAIADANERIMLQSAEIEVSSTAVRRRVAQGRPIRYLVPDGVFELIRAQGLYSQ